MNQLRQKEIPCAVCSKPSKVRGFCAGHYHEAYMKGTIAIRQRPDAIGKFLKKLHHNIDLRCNNPKVHKYEYYGGRGIKNELSLEDLRFLYERDNAASLTKPSIDRKESTGNYTVDNCRFIELSENRIRRTFSIVAECKVCSKKEVGAWKRGHKCVACAGQPLCKACNKPFQKNGRTTLCPACRSVTRPCHYCGKSITRDLIADSGCMSNKKWFCSKQEQGKWFGLNFGAGTRATQRRVA